MPDYSLAVCALRSREDSNYTRVASRVCSRHGRFLGVSLLGPRPPRSVRFRCQGSPAHLSVGATSVNMTPITRTPQRASGRLSQITLVVAAQQATRIGSCSGEYMLNFSVVRDPYIAIRRNPQSKKHKTWDFDGVLVVKGNWCELLDGEDGRK